MTLLVERHDQSGLEPLRRVVLSDCTLVEALSLLGWFSGNKVGELLLRI